MEKRICRHFGECGGCKFQDIDYKEQLNRKQDALGEIFSKHDLPIQALPIIGSPRIYYYRNKMEFSFSQDSDRLICGLHHAVHRRKVIDLKECIIFSQDLPCILGAVKEFFVKHDARVYSTFSHRGFLRHLVIREAKHTQDLMFHIVTSSQKTLDKEALAKSILRLSLKKKISSIIWTVNDALSDAVVPGNSQVLYGKDHIQENVDGLRFKIFAFSFFQVNPYILDDFYATLKSLLALSGEEKIIDLFCGVGTISLIVSKEAEFVWAVEQSSQAIENAYHNLALNNIKNVRFLSGNARKVLFTNMHVWRGAIDAVVVNPPRSGLSKKIIQRIKDIGPKKIIYSSCNPKSFSQDIKSFLDSYTIETIQPFDFFPHTPHVEVLSLLIRKS